MSRVSMEFRYYSSRGPLTCLRARETEEHHCVDPPTGGVRIAERRQPGARAIRLFDGGCRGADGEDPAFSAWPYARGIPAARLEEEGPDSGAGPLRHRVADGDAAENAVP